MTSGRGQKPSAAPLPRGADVLDVQMDLYEKFRKDPSEAVKVVDEFLRSTERGHIDGPDLDGKYIITESGSQVFTGGLEEAGRWCSTRVVVCWDMAWWMLEGAEAMTSPSEVVA